MALAFTQSARNDLITRDLRKAISVLNPSLNSSFKSIAFFSPDGTFVFALPTEREEENFTKSIFQRVIEVPISTAGDEEINSPGKLRFTYSWTPTALGCLALWLAILLFAYPIFQRIRLGIERRHREILQNRSAEIIAQVSTQVAHDIRSPLAALEAAIQQTENLSEAQKQLVGSATARIRNIANDLLDKNRQTDTQVDQELQPLGDLIEAIVTEKRAEYRSRTQVQIESRIAENLMAKVSGDDFKRVLSNLINNAMEATTNGSVRVALHRVDDIATLEVEDSGEGIPPAILKTLGERGTSHNKKSGSGLGLYHAKQCVNVWGGEFEITSQLNKGTRCTLRLPIVQRQEVVLIDDDTLTHQSWQITAKRKGIPLRCFAEYRKFESESERIPKTSQIYIDSDLRPENLKGEELAQELYARGYQNIFLATGKPASHFPPMPWIKAIVGKEPPWL